MENRRARKPNQKLRKAKIDPAKFRELRGYMPLRVVSDAVGVSEQHISNVERGVKSPSSDLLVRLCAFYKVGLEDVSKGTSTVAA